MTEKSEYPVSVLAVGEFQNDRMLLHDVFRQSGWRLLEAADRRRALPLLERMPVHVVIAESDLPNWNWKMVLKDLRHLEQPPELIVTSRTADDYLWAEALNVGAFDVLPQPLQRDEVERVVASARRHYDRPAARPVHRSVPAPASAIVA